MAPQIETTATNLLGMIEEAVDSAGSILEVQDDSLRRRLREASRKLSFAMEAPGDTIHRIGNISLQLVLAKLGHEKRVFDILAEANCSTLTTATLAQRTSIDPCFMRRLLRGLQSFGMIEQPGDDAYRANNCTRAMAGEAAHCGIDYLYDIVTPTFFSLPQFLAENGFTSPNNPNNAPWHLAHRTSLTGFAWVRHHPEKLASFLSWMRHNRDGLPVFLDVLDFEKEHGQTTDNNTVLFVDVGGAMGHQAILFKQRNRDLPGRIILQDLPAVIEQVNATGVPGFDGIETQAHDFFTPQPIKGARAYYMRNILHDWTDEKCVEILQNLRPAMANDSVILIDEMVLSECGAPWRATQLDFTMMSCLAAMERSRSEWSILLDTAGFEIRKIWKYTEECDDCIIVAVPK